MDTNNIAIIKWLVGLKPVQQTKAMLLIAIVALFTPLSIIFYSNKKMNESLNEKLKQQTEQCANEKIQLVDKYTVQIQDIQKSQIEKLEGEKERGERLDSVIRVSDKIISKKINSIE